MLAASKRLTKQASSFSSAEKGLRDCSSSGMGCWKLLFGNSESARRCRG